MKIAIFNPYFESLGGGEKVTSVMADHLSNNHEVTVLVKKSVDIENVEKFFDVNLSKVRFLEIPNDPVMIRLLTNRFSKLPGRWKSLLFDTSGLNALKKLKVDLFINNLYQSSMPSAAPKSIYMCMFPQKLSNKLTHRGLVKNTYSMFTDILEKVVIGTKAQAISSYTVVTANSKYTAGWIKKYWSTTAEVIYPVCDDMGPSVTKKQKIISVGRFFSDNGSSHHKKQHELIDAFIKMDNPHWELHLVGSAGEDDDTKRFMKKLNTLIGKRNNIILHPNMKLDDLKKLYRQSSIYWHATGLGYDSVKFPENQEHFGISTVEAMSAGVVPVVINSAGQQEIVSNDINGLLWNDKTELIELTSELINDPKRLEILSKEATKSSEQFNRKAFIKHLDKLILEVCNE